MEFADLRIRPQRLLAFGTGLERFDANSYRSAASRTGYPARAVAGSKPRGLESLAADNGLIPPGRMWTGLGSDRLFGGGRDWQRGLEKALYDEGEEFNPHYCGVIRTAGAIFGQAGLHCLNSCYRAAHCVGVERPRGERCVFLSLAQPNLVKCAPGPDMTSKSTAMMFNRCGHHLVSELEILRPNVMVFQGAKAPGAFSWAVKCAG